MMDYKDQLKLQSYLDGELTESEAREMASRLERDAEAVALWRELDQTGTALAGFEEGVKLPESRDFYWSKIRREIQQRETRPFRPVRPPWYLRVRRFLVPATGLAVIGLLALTVSRQTGGSPETSAETALEDSGAFTYHDYSAGATLVWLSYPAENELSEDDDLNSVD